MLAKLMSLFLLGLIRLLTGAQARWYGCPPKAEQRIYFANHQSHADIVMIWAALPQELRSITRPIAAKDYWTKTPFRQWITTAVFNAVYVDRASPKAPPVTATPGQAVAGDSLPKGPGLETATAAPSASAGAAAPTEAVSLPAQEASGPLTPAAAQARIDALTADDPLVPLVDALGNGDSVVIFPEGTRGTADEPQPFKAGLYKLAQMFPNAVLVPAWINNVQRVMPKGEVVPVPILCSVTFGAPIRVEDGEERRPFLDRARAAVIALRDV